MVTISFDDKKISVPQSWSDITLGNYEKWFMTEPRNRIEQVELVASICNIDSEILLDHPVQLFDTVYDIVKFAFDDYEGEASNKIEINKTLFLISQSGELTLAEWVDIETVYSEDSSSRLSDILSILCRPIGESYDSTICENRKGQFQDLTMDKALPLLAFFLQQRERYLTASNLCFQAQEEGSRYLYLIQNFVKNGDGIKLLPIWQRIKYYFLMKYFKRKLSKFSDSFSTESTSLKQKVS